MGKRRRVSGENYNERRARGIEDVGMGLEALRDALRSGLPYEISKKKAQQTLDLTRRFGPAFQREAIAAQERDPITAALRSGTVQGLNKIFRRLSQGSRGVEAAAQERLATQLASRGIFESGVGARQQAVLGALTKESIESSRIQQAMGAIGAGLGLAVGQQPIAPTMPESVLGTISAQQQSRSLGLQAEAMNAELGNQYSQQQGQMWAAGIGALAGGFGGLAMAPALGLGGGAGFGLGFGSAFGGPSPAQVGFMNQGQTQNAMLAAALGL